MIDPVLAPCPYLVPLHPAVPIEGESFKIQYLQQNTDVLSRMAVAHIPAPRVSVVPEVFRDQVQGPNPSE